MLVLNLCCGNEHRFEGWFGSAADFESQVAQALIECPICANSQITRRPTAPHLNVSHLRAAPAAPQRAQGAVAPSSNASSGSAPSTATAPSMPSISLDASAEVQRKLHAALAQVLADTEDVGDQFAEEARRIHYGETDAHGIRGQATADEVAELLDEGIAVLPLALPPALKGPLQ